MLQTTRTKRTTKDRLMDAAEKLFARRGFHGTSLREITGAAKADLALVNYHFGGKKQLLIAPHTRRHLKEEITFPGPVIDRANRDRWIDEGKQSLMERAAKEVNRLIETFKPTRLPETTKHELTRLMQYEAKRYGMEVLPARNE